MKSITIMSLMVGTACLWGQPAWAESPPDTGRIEALHTTSIATVTDLTNTLEAVDQKVRNCKDKLLEQVVITEQFGASMGDLADAVAGASNTWVANPTDENRARLIEELSRFAQRGADLAGEVEEAQGSFGQILAELRDVAAADLENVRAEHANVVAFQGTIAVECKRIDADIERIAGRLDGVPAEELPDVLVDALDAALIYRDEINYMAQTWDCYEAVISVYAKDIEWFSQDLGRMERQQRRTGRIMGSLRRNFEGTAQVIGTAAALELITATHREIDEVFQRHSTISEEVEGLVGPLRQTSASALQILGQREPRTPHIDRDAPRENVLRFLSERNEKLTTSP